MRARDIVGKKVVAVEQVRVRASDGKLMPSLERIRFADGSSLAFSTIELDSAADYGLHGIYCSPEPKCGHSACRQNWIDTNTNRCIARELEAMREDPNP